MNDEVMSYYKISADERVVDNFRIDWRKNYYKRIVYVAKLLFWPTDEGQHEIGHLS